MEFAPICVYLVISLLLSLILIGLSFLFASSSSLTYPEKLSAYECGFEGGRKVTYSYQSVRPNFTLGAYGLPSTGNSRGNKACHKSTFIEARRADAKRLHFVSSMLHFVSSMLHFVPGAVMQAPWRLYEMRLEERSFSGKHTLQPFGLVHLGKHANARWPSALCLLLVKTSKALVGVVKYYMGADHLSYWGQTTKRHLEALQPIGDTGEIQSNDFFTGSQRTRSTCLTRKRPGNRKALATSPVNGKGSRYLLSLSRFYSTQPEGTTPLDPGVDVTENVRYGVDSLLGLWIHSYKKPFRVYYDLGGFLRNIGIWIIAYKLSQKVTPGPDQTTIDGTSLEKLLKLRDAIVKGEFEWGATRIPKPGKNEKRPLGVSCFQDRIVQEVLRMILEPIYEPRFSTYSHGFRPGRSAHTALNVIMGTFHGAQWYIEGSLEAEGPGAVNHGTLYKIIRRTIRDKRILKLIRSGLQAFFHMPHGEIEEATIGAARPFGLSPLLSNIYLNELDHFIETTIREYNKARRADASRLNPTNRRRMHYIRFADDFLVAISGPRSEAVKLRSELESFLRDKLQLTLSMDKTHITHVSKGVPFLGHNIFRSMRWQPYGSKSRRFASESHEGAFARKNLTVFADTAKYIKRLQTQGFLKGNEPQPCFGYMHFPQSETNFRINAILRGLNEWFRHAQNRRRIMWYFSTILRHSLAKMYAAKFKLGTRAQVFKIAGRDLGKRLSAKPEKIPLGITDQTVEDWQKSVSGKGTPRQPSGWNSI
uniref:Putative reverse transcriptase and intron maturase n=1 Tax=Chara vulgaris TaxID=55564 RepID=Q7YAJ3_CHAVU|nr:putative reverse transcriptase and intron maturase [Chara vulgaris]AAP92213.1 putative reverse transcriptase and intron maturase [Chara vulgaris]